MFVDESGEANITNADPSFNTFVLCGILFREDHYNEFNARIKALKQKLFGNEDVIFHSYEMRKRIDNFTLFNDPEIQLEFYTGIGKIFKECRYSIIACIIDKPKYKEKYNNKNNAYEDALMFLCERAIMCVGRKNKIDKILVCLEKRGKGKDRLLKKYYGNFIKYGTPYISTEEFKMCDPNLYFRAKDQNINGLQLCDLFAYPIGRKFLYPDKPQPTFDIFEEKFFCNNMGNYKGLGLKTFP